MPSKSREQQKMIFAKRGQYKTKENTPQKDKWVWDSGWGKLEEGTFDWPYLKLGKDGILYDEHGDKIFGKGVPKFKSVDEAEKWLEDNDERGTVTGLKEDEGQEFIDDIKKKPKISLVTKTLYPTEIKSDSSNMSTAPVSEALNPSYLQMYAFKEVKAIPMQDKKEVGQLEEFQYKDAKNLVSVIKTIFEKNPKANIINLVLDKNNVSIKYFHRDLVMEGNRVTFIKLINETIK